MEIDYYIYINFSLKGRQIPYGLVVRIRRSHRRGPGSIPGVGTTIFFPLSIRFWYHQVIFAYVFKLFSNYHFIFLFLLHKYETSV